MAGKWTLKLICTSYQKWTRSINFSGSHIYIYLLGGGFKDLLFSPLLGEDFQFDYCNFFQMGWNHQLEIQDLFLEGFFKMWMTEIHQLHLHLAQRTPSTWHRISGEIWWWGDLQFFWGHYHGSARLKVVVSQIFFFKHVVPRFLIFFGQEV